MEVLWAEERVTYPNRDVILTNLPLRVELDGCDADLFAQAGSVVVHSRSSVDIVRDMLLSSLCA